MKAPLLVLLLAASAARDTPPSSVATTSRVPMPRASSTPAPILPARTRSISARAPAASSASTAASAAESTTATAPAARSAPAATEGAKRIPHGEHGLIYLARETIDRRLQGDWEPPDAVVIVYTPAWSDLVAELVEVVAEQATVYLLVPAGESVADAEQWLDDYDLGDAGVQVIDIPVDTPWVRDYGPLVVHEADGSVVWLDAVYDATRPDDDLLPGELGERLGATVEGLDVPLDGGAVISNGEGLCAATAESMERADLDAYDPVQMESLQRSLGCPTLALVPALPREKTTHVDISAQFLAPDLVAVAWTDPVAHPEEAALLDDTAETLAAAAAARRTPLEVVRVYMPIAHDDIHFTYLNGVRLPHDFVVPSYESVETSDELQAYSELKHALGLTGLIPIPAEPLIELSGAWHCVTVGLARPPAHRRGGALGSPLARRREPRHPATVTR